MLWEGIISVIVENEHSLSHSKEIIRSWKRNNSGKFYIFNLVKICLILEPAMSWEGIISVMVEN